MTSVNDFESSADYCCCEHTGKTYVGDVTPRGFFVFFGGEGNADEVPGVDNALRRRPTGKTIGVSHSLFERRLVLVDLLARELFELEEHVLRGRPSVELRRYRLAVLQRLVDLLPSVEHGGQFVAGRGRRTRRHRSVVHGEWEIRFRKKHAK